MDKISTNIKQRVLEYLDFKGIKRNDLFLKTGLAPSNFKGKSLESELGGDKVAKILTYYEDLNPDWLMTGKGNMMRATREVQKVEPDEGGIPLIPIEAMAGFGQGDVQALVHDCEFYIIPLFKGADFLITVRGMSMYPKYSSGDIIACKRVSMTDIFFQWNKVYVLDSEQGALIKRVRKGSKEGAVELVSENPDYQSFEIDLGKVRSVALVMGVIRLE